MIEWLREFLVDREARAKREFLRKVPLFRSLGDRAVALVHQSLTQRDYQTGETVFSEGEASRALVLIESGHVEILKAGPDGSSRRLRALGPGDYVGELALLEARPRTATAVTAAVSRVLFLHKDQLETLIASHPEIGVAVFREFSRTLADRFLELERRWLAGEAPGSQTADGAPAPPLAGDPEAPGEPRARVRELERALVATSVELARLRERADDRA